MGRGQTAALTADFLETGVDAGTRRIGSSALCKCTTPHATTALDELDNNAVLIQSISDIFPTSSPH